MGLREDVERFKQVGEEKRQDLKKFIAQGNIQAGDDIKVPIKIIELPSFEYARQDAGGVSQGEGEVGDPVDQPGEEGEEPGEPGEEGEEHGHYQMSPEEFAKELDEKKVKNTVIIKCRPKSLRKNWMKNLVLIWNQKESK